MVHILTIYFFANTIILLAIKEINMENVINFIALYLVGFLIGKGTIKILSFIKNTTLKVLTIFIKVIKNKNKRRKKMKYNFKGTFTEYDEKENFVTTYSYYLNDIKVNINDLKKILRILENPETTLEREKVIKMIRNI